MQVLGRGDLFGLNPEFARFAQQWQNRHYHPALSYWRPGPAVIDGEDVELDEAACEVLNRQMDRDFRAMQDDLPSEAAGKGGLARPLLRCDVATGQQEDADKISSLCSGLAHGFQFLDWDRLLLIGLHAQSVYFEDWQTYEPYVAARDALATLGMSGGFTGGLALEREDIPHVLPHLLQAVFVQAFPLAMAGARSDGVWDQIFGVFSDRGQILGHFGSQPEQDRFESAMRSGKLRILSVS